MSESHNSPAGLPSAYPRLKHFPMAGISPGSTLSPRAPLRRFAPTSGGSRFRLKRRNAVRALQWLPHHPSSPPPEQGGTLLAPQGRNRKTSKASLAGSIIRHRASSSQAANTPAQTLPTPYAPRRSKQLSRSCAPRLGRPQSGGTGQFHGRTSPDAGQLPTAGPNPWRDLYSRRPPDGSLGDGGGMSPCLPGAVSPIPILLSLFYLYFFYIFLVFLWVFLVFFFVF